MSTELGKMIRIWRIRKGEISQEALAAELNYSAGYFSNIITGKIDPDMEFLIKCRNYFNLNKEETIELFHAAFLSSKTITLQPAYLTPERKNWLVKVLTTFLLMPEPTSYNSAKAEIERSVEAIAAALNKFTEFKTL
jgi:transcriptional regulator with XRE-family HTH domain